MNIKTFNVGFVYVYTTVSAIVCFLDVPM